MHGLNFRVTINTNKKLKTFRQQRKKWNNKIKFRKEQEMHSKMVNLN